MASFYVSVTITTAVVASTINFSQRTIENPSALLVDAFQTSPSFSSSLHSPRRTIFGRRSAGGIQIVALNGSGDSNAGPGMDDAFRQLQELTSLDESSKNEYDTDGNESSSTAPSGTSRSNKKTVQRDEAFAQAMKELNLQDIAIGDESSNHESSSSSSFSSLPAVTLESEAELYKDMVSEISDAGGSDEMLMAAFKTDLILGGDVDDIEERAKTKAKEKFMDRAIDEALMEVRGQNADVELNKSSLLDNTEIMTEIEKIFDKANAELLAGLEEIRTEQMILAREQAERNARASQQKIDEDEQRMAAAEANMKKILVRVNSETRNVEKAIEDLKKAQAEAEEGLDGQLSNLKSSGLVKQAALAGTLLFTLRSGVETVALVGGDPTHVTAALIQGALAVLCLAAFLFL